MTRSRTGEGRPWQRSQDGRWVLDVRDADGRRRRLYGWTRDEVLEGRAEHDADRLQGIRPPARTYTVGRLLSDWLEDRRGKVRPSTWVSYEGHVRIHLAPLERVPLARLAPADVRRLLRELEAGGLSPRTIAYSLTVLRMALRQAVDDGMLARNVASAVKPPKGRPPAIVFLELADVRQLLADTRDDELGPLWAVLVGTGLRLGEALGLRWADVRAGSISVTGALRPLPRAFRPGEAWARGDRDVRLVRVPPKTAAGRRTFAAPAFVLEALERHRERSAELPKSVLGLVFTTPRGTAHDPRNVARIWDRTKARLELPPELRIHDLRHTAASLMLAQGLTLDDVKRVLGHESIRITVDTYGHLVEGRSREIAAALDRAIGGER